VGIVAAAVAGMIAALAAIGYGIEADSSIAIGVTTFVSLAVALAVYQRWAFGGPRALPSVRFPAEERDTHHQ
jgi:hypothetical protein